MNELKAAEKKATAQVQEQRKARTDRMKEAKSEAERAIAAYRSEQERSYDLKRSQKLGESGSDGSALESKTNAEISNMTRDFNARKEGVEQCLVDLVCRVNISVPKARGHA